MDMESRKIKLAVAFLGTAVLAWSTGFFFAPTKTKEIEKIVVKEVRVAVTDVDRTTKTTKKTTKTGEIVEETVITDKSKVKETAQIDSKTDRLKVVERKNDDWLVGGGVLWGIDGSKHYQAHVGRRILGGLYLDAIGSTDRTFGLGLSFRF